MHRLPSSYRDNSGYVFEQDGKVYRMVDQLYFPQLQKLMSSGLYEQLNNTGLLISHTEVSSTRASKTLLPAQLPFISYPYEWSFGQWKDAALATLDINLAAIEKGMILKDATPYNIQFMQGKAVHIDTLSLDDYDASMPWIAYRQFVQSFLGPLLLMHYCHPSANRLMSAYPDGIPVDLLVTLLPKRTRWNLQVYLHVHLQAKYAGKSQQKGAGSGQFSQKKMTVLLDGLRSLVNTLSLKKTKTTWDDYYSDTITGNDYLEHKSKLVTQMLGDRKFEKAIDLGANDGHFSFLVKDKADLVIAIDGDPNCINALYGECTKAGIRNLLPLVIDLLAPSPAIGWNNTERTSITERLRGDLVMALALIHHLAIGHNIPLEMIRDWIRPMAPLLLIEFVPKEDDKVQLLLQNREDIFSNYSLDHFRNVFGTAYEILNEATVGNTSRTLFLMKRK